MLLSCLKTCIDYTGLIKSNLNFYHAQLGPAESDSCFHCRPCTPSPTTPSLLDSPCPLRSLHTGFRLFLNSSLSSSVNGFFSLFRPPPKKEFKCLLFRSLFFSGQTYLSLLQHIHSPPSFSSPTAFSFPIMVYMTTCYLKKSVYCCFPPIAYKLFVLFITIATVPSIVLSII